jgi:hypothetical protein
MKLKNLFLAIAISMVAIGFNSCTKSSSSTGTTTASNSTEAQQQANDQTSYTNETNAVTDDVNAVLNNNGGTYNARPTGVDSFITFSLACDVSIAVDTFSTLRTITLTYSGSNCNLSRTRTGTVVVSFDSAFRWGTPGAQLTVAFNNLQITNLLTNSTITLNGTRIMTNVSGGLLKNLATTDSIVHTVTDSGMSVTFADSGQRTWQNSFRRVFTYNNGINISVTGSTAGTNRFGHNFSCTITQPLVVNQSCDFRYTSGQVQDIGSLVTTTTTFGLDINGNPVSGCATILYYKITWTGVDGKPLSYTVGY